MEEFSIKKKMEVNSQPEDCEVVDQIQNGFQIQVDEQHRFAVGREAQVLHNHLALLPSQDAHQ